MVQMGEELELLSCQEMAPGSKLEKLIFQLPLAMKSELREGTDENS